MSVCRHECVTSCQILPVKNFQSETLTSNGRLKNAISLFLFSNMG